MTVKPTQVDCVDRSASRAAHPQEPIARCDGSADCWREQHRHSFGLALVPGGDQTFGILKHLWIGGAPVRRFLFRGFAALILHLALVEPHGPHGTSKRNSAKAAAFS